MKRIDRVQYMDRRGDYSAEVEKPTHHFTHFNQSQDHEGHARRLAAHRKRIREHLAANPDPTSYSKMTIAQKKKAIAMRAEGLSYGVIAQKLGVEGAQVWNACNADRVSERERKRSQRRRKGDAA